MTGAAAITPSRRRNRRVRFIYAEGWGVGLEGGGYGRAYPPGRRQIVGSVTHISDNDRYRRLNDVVCVCVGEVRAPVDLDQKSPDLVIDVAELIWEPIAE